MMDKEKCFSQILSELKQEKEEKEKNKDTDDEISEGNSDQQGPQNDL